MKRIDSYKEYSTLCTAYLRRGVRTNAFSDTESCRREIDAGTLFAAETDGALLLFRERGTHLRMNFYLRLQEPLPLPVTRTIVTEIAFRERDTALAQTVDFWRMQGFLFVFRRTRLCRPAALPPISSQIPVRTAQISDTERAASLLARNFDPLTGCLPMPEELEDCIRKGEILLTEHGILHFVRERASAELRHLAVDAAWRGRGEAQALLSAFLRETNEQRTCVWVRQGNTPAEAIYRKNGFAPDGFTSAVLIREKGIDDSMETLLEILKEIRPDVDFENETALIDDGILESLDIVAIVGEIMEAFDVELNVDDLLPENFNSVEAMLELIRSKEN